jgi:hypothetical protein
MDRKSQSTVAVVIVSVIFLCQLALIFLNPPWQFSAFIAGLVIDAVIGVWALRNKLQRLNQADEPIRFRRDLTSLLTFGILKNMSSMLTRSSCQACCYTSHRPCC